MILGGLGVGALILKVSPILIGGIFTYFTATKVTKTIYETKAFENLQKDNKKLNERINKLSEEKGKGYRKIAERFDKDYAKLRNEYQKQYEKLWEQQGKCYEKVLRKEKWKNLEKQCRPKS